MDPITRLLAQEFQVKPEHAQAVVELFDRGNTVPFIADTGKSSMGPWMIRPFVSWRIA